MRNVGIKRCVDPLGRIVVPREFRTAMEIKDDEPMEVSMEDWDGEKVIIIRKPPLDSPIAPHVKALEEAAEKVAPGFRDNYRRQMTNIRAMLGL
jgi:bifunctional DNA-binding transcriptional regulator/antitoxin component of YhaV-PrlF toxin-antitoxin module